MAFDAAPESPADILPAAMLRSLSADKAGALYALAAQLDHPKVWRIAAHALAGALERATLAADNPPASITPPAPEALEAPEARPPKAPRRTARPAKIEPPAGPDLAAPLGKIPRNKTAAGDFWAIWADGSSMLVRGAVYHAAKPETRWAAAYQAADRLRRLRSRHAYLADLQRGAHVDYQMNAGGLMVDNPQWRRLVAVRPLPALAALYDADSGETMEAAAGTAWGAGDAIEAAAIEAAICSPRVLMNRPAYLYGLEFRQSVMQGASRMTAEPYGPPAPVQIATACPGAPVGETSLYDLDGQSVMFRADLAARAADETEGLERYQSPEARRDTARLIAELVGHAATPTLYTLRRGIGGRTYEITRSDGRAWRMAAETARYLARPAA